MKQCMSYRRMGFFITAMIFLFTLTTFVQADAKQSSLKTELRKNGISMKLVKLDRTDGFTFGLSFKGPQKQSIVIASGLDRMFLVVAGDKEMILQADGAGNMQIIQANGSIDYKYLLCVATSVLQFLSDLSLCTSGDWACYVTPVLTLVTGIISCPTTTT